MLISCLASANTYDFSIEKTWKRSELNFKAPAQLQKSTSDKITGYISSFMKQMTYKEVKYKKLYNLHTAHASPTKEQIALYVNIHRSPFTYTNANHSELGDNISKTSQTVLSDVISNHPYIKGLFNGIELDINPEMFFSTEKKQPILTYTIITDYLEIDKKGSDQASLGTNRYTLESAGKLKPVYKVVPVFRQRETTKEADLLKKENDLINTHNEQMDQLTYTERIGNLYEEWAKDLVKFKTKIIPDRSQTTPSIVIHMNHHSGIYGFTKNTAESDEHHKLKIPVKKFGSLSYELKGDVISKSSIDLHHKKFIPGSLKFSSDYVTKQNYLVYSDRNGPYSYTVKGSINNSTDAATIEYIFNLRL